LSLEIFTGAHAKTRGKKAAARWRPGPGTFRRALGRADRTDAFREGGSMKSRSSIHQRRGARGLRLGWVGGIAGSGAGTIEAILSSPPPHLKKENRLRGQPPGPAPRKSKVCASVLFLAVRQRSRAPAHGPGFRRAKGMARTAAWPRGRLSPIRRPNQNRGRPRRGPSRGGRGGASSFKKLLRARD